MLLFRLERSSETHAREESHLLCDKNSHRITAIPPLVLSMQGEGLAGTSKRITLKDPIHNQYPILYWHFLVSLFFATKVKISKRKKEEENDEISITQKYDDDWYGITVAFPSIAHSKLEYQNQIHILGLLSIVNDNGDIGTLHCIRIPLPHTRVRASRKKLFWDDGTWLNLSYE